MATIEGIMGGGRNYLRDFPRFFTASVQNPGTPRFLQLPHKNVAPQELFVQGVGPTRTVTGRLAIGGAVADGDHFLYTLDVREGLLKIKEAPTDGGWGDVAQFNIDGYRFEWISPGDLQFCAEVVLAEHAADDPDFDIAQLGDAHEDLLCLGTAIEACWMLLFEYSRDIDVSTPEAVGLPLTQRFRQVEDLLAMLLDKYRTKANLLGVGLERIKVAQLRRQSRSINRLVPIYKSREWDDAAFPVRIFPPIDQSDQSTPQPGFKPARAITGYYEEIPAFTDVSEGQ